MDYSTDLKELGTVELLIENENLLSRAQEVLDELHKREYLLWERLVKLVFPDADNDADREDLYSDMEVETLVEMLEQAKNGSNHSS